ncbi:hypothetical protein [Colwellia psychrerythraea]|uniref:Uncharacterized protein n=1 Tax=Colwellia psychrerythraea TaxID=28229 RepID=A0A099KF40_COLPS|nr:hypothetical protein [Colwellia psychrerythraea]KGJ88218.1 hypothetical protein GAB14E_4247 [Colwellia psychrerythraea]
MKVLFLFLLIISTNTFAEKVICDVPLDSTNELILSKSFVELENKLNGAFKKIEQAHFKLKTLNNVECYTELLNSSRLYISVIPSSKDTWIEKELGSTKQAFESNSKHLWVLANQYRNTLQNYIRFNSKACNVKNLENGKILLNKLTNNFGDYFTSVQLEQNIKFENMSASCITS